MNTKSVVLTYYLLHASIFYCYSQLAKAFINPSETLSYGHQEVFHSEILDEDRFINISLPKSFNQGSSAQTYPVMVLYGDHGNEFFLTTAGIVNHLSAVHRMPEFIVISFDEATYHNPEVYANGMWGPNRKTIESDGNPDLMIRHLKEELFPFLATEYKAADYRTIVGVSGSSIFPLHSFAKATDLFQSYIIVAAADIIGMGYEPNLSFIDSFKERLTSEPPTKSHFYLGVAEGDLSWNAAYTDNLERLRKTLATHESTNFKSKVEIITDEVHYDSYIKALLSAFELIFPKVIWSTRYVDLIHKEGNALQNIDVFHQQLSESYGFTILPLIERWNNQNSLDRIGYRLLDEERETEAIELFDQIVNYRPYSARALENLSIGLESNNQLHAAITAQQKAIEIASQYPNEDPDEFLLRLRELEKKLASKED